MANEIIEIFSITLKPGTGDQFHQLYIERSLPLQHQYNVDLVAFGPSLHDKDSYIVVRRYNNLDERTQNQGDFYGSEEWKSGPREPLLALMQNYTTVVVPVNISLMEGFRRMRL